MKFSRPLLYLAPLVGLIALGSFTYVYYAKPGPSYRETQSLPEGVKRPVEASANRLTAAFYRSQKYPLVHVGEAIPDFRFIDVKGHSYNLRDFKETLVLTFGSETSSSIRAMQDQIKGKARLIHFIYDSANFGDNKLDINNLNNFDGSTTLVDSKSQTAIAEKNKRLLNILGIIDNWYMIVAREGKVIYLNNTIAKSPSEANLALINILSGKKAVSEPILRSGDNIKLSLIGVKDTSSLKNFETKNINVVVFSDDKCSSCGNVSSDGSIFAQELSHNKEGLIIVSSSDKDNIQTIGNKLLINIAKTQNSLGSGIPKLWNVRSFPSVMIVKNNQFLGWVGYDGLTVNGQAFSDIQFRAAKSIIDAMK